MKESDVDKLPKRYKKVIETNANCCYKQHFRLAYY